MATWGEIMKWMHATLERVRPGTDPDLLARRGLELDAAGNYFFNRPAEAILRTRLATGCDDYVKVFVHKAREEGIEAWMVWGGSRLELEVQEPGRPLMVEGSPLVLDRMRSRRLLSGHQVAAILDGGTWSLVDPSSEGEQPIPFAALPGAPARPEDLAGKVLEGGLLEKAWPRFAAKLRDRGRAEDGLVFRRVSSNTEDGNSAERLQKIYASGNPDAASFVVEAAGWERMSRGPA